VSRGAWIAILSVGALIGLILGSPYACWEADCGPIREFCSGCDNLLGMTVPDGQSYVGLILVSVLLGGAVGWLVGFAISKLRARSE
jgi:hypothetical protein